MKKLILIILQVVFILQLTAQTLSGKVTDEQNQAIEFANIALFNLPDSTLITGTVTNANGEFSFEKAAAKNAFLRISFIGYETRVVPATSGQTVVLKDDSKMLGEVVVKGTRNVFQMQNGNMVANVSGTVLGKEVNAMEVLRKIPGMTLKDGQLSSFIGGKPIIYINGKKAQSMTEVQQLEVKSIKSVELNTNPGAEYDATAGAVLLITTHKCLEGLSVQVQSVGRHNSFFSHDNSVKINYKKDRFNFFGNIGFSDYQRKQVQENITTIFTPDTTWKNSVVMSDLKNTNKTLMYSLGMDYSLSQKHSFGVKYDFGYSKINNINTQPLTQTANDVVTTQVNGQSDKTDKGNSHYINGYYRGQLTDKIHLQVFADWLNKNSNERQIVTESSSKYGNKETLINMKSDYELFGFAPILFYTFNTHHRLSVGTEFNAVDVNTQLSYQPHIFSETRTNTSETKFAGYVNYSFSNEKGFSITTGMRYEWVDAKYVDKLNNENDIQRTYKDFFPSLQISYQKGLATQTLSYRSGITRPSFSSLNGNTFYINQFMYQEGNPKLKPEILHNFQYNLMYRFVYFALQYRHVKNAIKNDFQTLSPTSNVMKSTYNNYDKMEQLQAVLNLRHKFGFYTPSLTLAYMQNFMKVNTNEGIENINKPFGYMDFNNDIDLPNGFLFNAQYIYTGRGTSGFMTFDPTHVFNARIQKALCDNKLQISLSANDIFGKINGQYTGRVNNIHISQLDYLDNRSLTLNVIWRFNNYKKSYKGQSASQDELNRL